MRRPLKPFVTEYRGGTRRQSGSPAPKSDFSSFDQEQPAVETQGFETRSAETRVAESTRRGDTQEDSYEAAMRAADALFSARQPVPDENDPAREGAATHAAGGRVLRVLDEPPSPELLRLEAERAPKRRGRKPGSKNKPKPRAPVVTQVALVAQPEDEAWPEDDAPTTAPAAVLAEPTRIGAMALVAARTGGTAPAALARTGDRYAWVRTKLKPGQQWKRRLPKVAW